MAPQASRKLHFAIVLAVITLWGASSVFAQDLDTGNPAIQGGYIQLQTNQTFIACSGKETTLAAYLVESANTTAVTGNVTFGDYAFGAIPIPQGPVEGLFMAYLLNSTQLEMYSSGSNFDSVTGEYCGPSPVSYCNRGSNILPLDTYCVAVFSPGEETLDLVVAVAWQRFDDSGNSPTTNSDYGPTAVPPPTPLTTTPTATTATATLRDPTLSSALSVTVSWLTIVVAILLSATIALEA